MKNKSLASMAFEKLSAIRDDKSCKMCGKSAKEGCECDERDMDMPEEEMEDSMEESEPMYKKDEEKAPGVVINIALGKQWDKYRGGQDD
jgi:hypothetical protein